MPESKLKKQKQLQKYLDEQLDLAEKARTPLNYSLEKAKKIAVLQNQNAIKAKDHLPFSDQEAEVMEALTSRFARLSDILIQKVFRAIDALELSPMNTFCQISFLFT